MTTCPFDRRRQAMRLVEAAATADQLRSEQKYVELKKLATVVLKNLKGVDCNCFNGAREMFSKIYETATLGRANMQMQATGELANITDELRGDVEFLRSVGAPLSPLMAAAEMLAADLGDRVRVLVQSADLPVADPTAETLDVLTAARQAGAFDRPAADA